jgi:hypothetical protein
MKMELKRLGASSTELRLGSGAVILFSYETPVAVRLAGGTGYLKTSRFHSRTTSRHIADWLRGASSVREVSQDEIDKIVSEAN